ncbi:MAG: NUMOD3 domain-containing DNA-binding protein [Nitrososphaerales archaeon]
MAKKGRIMTDEHKLKISLAQKGKPRYYARGKVISLEDFKIKMENIK